MPDLTDDTIKDLLAMSNPGLRAALEAMLPKPTYPEHMLGLWAQHPEYGRVLVIDDRPDEDGEVTVSLQMEERTNEVSWGSVPVSELTFPHHVTRPEDVPEGEAWIVNVEGGVKSYTRIVALKDERNYWRTAGAKTPGYRFWDDSEVTLITPLVPARPAPAVEWVETEEEYEALPPGSIVADDMDFPLIKRDTELWYESGGTRSYSNFDMSYSRRRVYRRGWGNE